MRNYYGIASHFLFSICLLLLPPTLTAQQTNSAEAGNGSDNTRILTNDFYDNLAANRLLHWISNNGTSSHNPITGGAGTMWPGENGASVIYQDGLVWGGKIEGYVMIGGSTYRGGLQAGNILPDGTTDPVDAKHRIYGLSLVNRSGFMALDTSSQKRMRQDFREWPATLGAPYVDVDGDGSYTPDFDSWLDDHDGSDHPYFAGEQILWFVSNDLDARRTADLYGSPPIGLEMRVYAWASASDPLLDNTVFVEYTIIHRGASDLTEFHLARWSDPDLGAADNDYLGLDLAQNMQYVFNATGSDTAFAGPPPAFGYIWLQTPLEEQSGAVADYGLGTRSGYRNVPVSAFTYYINSDPTYQDPDLGDPAGTLQMFNNLNGALYDYGPQVDPTNGEETKTALDGDPIFETGWRDGIVHGPGDRRMLGSCSVDRFAMGDTQKVVFALHIADGGNAMLSVRQLRNEAQRLHDHYQWQRSQGEPPELHASITWPDAGSYAVHVTASSLPTGSLTALLEDEAGNLISSAAMLDDGQHDDGGAGDGMFGAVIPGSRIPTGGTVSVMNVVGGDSALWFVENDLPLAGDIDVSINAVMSDHLNYDGKINPGENVRLQLHFENSTIDSIPMWYLFPVNEANAIVPQHVYHFRLPVAGGSAANTVYDPTTTTGYLTVQVPENASPGIFECPIVVLVEGRGMWRDTLRMLVEPFGTPPAVGRLEHLTGSATGTLDYVVADWTAFKPHFYYIQAEGEYDEEVTFSIRDESLRKEVASGLPFPDALGHDAQIVDGWKLLSGSTHPGPAYDGDGNLTANYDGQARAQWSHPERTWLEFYADYLITGEVFFGSSLLIYDIYPVRLVFDATQTQKAYRWLRGGDPSYGYVSYDDIAVRAYDMSDSLNPRQITLGYIENKGGAREDGQWNPQEIMDREYLFVFDDDYTTTPQTKYQGVIISDAIQLPCVFAMWAYHHPGLPMYENGDAMTIIPTIPVSKQDAYILDMSAVTSAEGNPPVTGYFSLHQNYPNPGRGQTVISFDAGRSGYVRLELYDLLGRKCRTLHEGFVNQGRHTIPLSTATLQPGTYFYRLTAGGTQLLRRMQILH
ncbi:T9SS type A sorting domain-containing protein [bacterium]|nr:T9SS type A sorting domain-containing protein [bacterium]